MKASLNRALALDKVYIYMPYDICISGKLVRMDGFGGGYYYVSINGGASVAKFKASDVAGVMRHGASFMLKGSEASSYVRYFAMV